MKTMTRILWLLILYAVAPLHVLAQDSDNMLNVVKDRQEKAALDGKAGVIFLAKKPDYVIRTTNKDEPVCTESRQVGGHYEFKLLLDVSKGKSRVFVVNKKGSPIAGKSDQLNVNPDEYRYFRIDEPATILLPSTQRIDKNAYFAKGEKPTEALIDIKSPVRLDVQISDKVKVSGGEGTLTGEGTYQYSFVVNTVRIGQLKTAAADAADTYRKMDDSANGQWTDDQWKRLEQLKDASDNATREYAEAVTVVLQGNGTNRIPLQAALIEGLTPKDKLVCNLVLANKTDTIVKKDTDPKGTVVVASNVSRADFYVDGVKQISGGVPPFVYKGTEGRHKLTLRADGYNDETAEVDIRLGRTVDYRMNMVAAGSLSLDGVSYEMVLVEGGTFTMGSQRELDKYSTFSMDKPAHSVTVGTFAIGKTEVTQVLWQKVMGSNPSAHQGGDLPVENVSWDDCQQFIARLNSMTGQQFRLPTEAEWEYAARGRTASGDSYSGGSRLDDVAVTGSGTAACGGKRPNVFGLCDMTGNVAEWCQDFIKRYTALSANNPRNDADGYERVVRGGAYDTGGWLGHTSHRSHMKQHEARPTVGLRLAQDKK